jgi:hypothetical protein
MLIVLIGLCKIWNLFFDDLQDNEAAGALRGDVKKVYDK